MRDNIFTDEELVARCQGELPGDTQSFEALVQRYENRIYTLVYCVVAQREEAEDVTQEVFLKVYRQLSTLNQQASFAAWLYRIATNAALDALERSKHRPQAAATPPSQADAITPLDHQPSALPGPEESALQAELRACIQQVLGELEQDQARVLVMRDFENLNYEDIASSLDLGLSAVKMRIHRARLAFQHIFLHSCGRFYLTDAVTSGKKDTRERVRKG